jgi:ABC-2 type transport system permease protein
LIRLVSAELLKLRTTRSFWGLAGATLGLVVLITVLTLALDSHLGSEHDVRSLLSTAGSSGFLLLVLGVVFSAGEYRHGTIASTLLVTPDRLRVSASKALACAAAGLGVGLVIAAVTAIIALPWLSAKDVHTLSAGQLFGLFLGGILYTALACALGAGVGSLLRNQVAAVVVVLVLFFVIDPAVTALAEGYTKYSLAGLGVTLSGGPAGDVGTGELLPFWLAALLWSAYTAVLVVGAAVLTSRRDI